MKEFKYIITEMAYNQKSGYSSDPLPNGYVFYTETYDTTTRVEICEDKDWNEIFSIETDIAIPFTDDDISNLEDKLYKMLAK